MAVLLIQWVKWSLLRVIKFMAEHTGYMKNSDFVKQNGCWQYTQGTLL